MTKNIFEIVERIKKLKGYKTDREVAESLKMTLGALSNHKTRRTIPYDALSSFCESEGVSFDWLLTGEGSPQKGHQVCEERTIYNNVREDPEMEEIIRLLREYPQDKKLVLKLLKGKKDIKEALDGLQIRHILNEGG